MLETIIIQNISILEADFGYEVCGWKDGCSN